MNPGGPADSDVFFTAAAGVVGYPSISRPVERKLNSRLEKSYPPAEDRESDRTNLVTTRDIMM